MFIRVFKNHISFFFGLFLVLFGLAYIYRGALLQGKVLFPSNLLAAFYSPWSTMTFPGWGRGIPNKPIGGNDQVRLFYPGKTVTNEAIKKGKFPLWNPYIFAGSPHLANFQSAVFYPLNILFLIFSQIDAWSILTITPLILSFLFMYLFLRTIACNQSASVIGSLAFAFCGFLSTWTQENAAVGQSALWLPLMMYGVNQLISTNKLRYLLLTSLAMTFSFLGGFYQVTFYAMAVTFCYGLFLLLSSKNNLFRNLFVLVLPFLLTLALVAVQLLPSSEAFFDSPRGFSSVWYLFDQYLLPFVHLVRIVFPDITGNPGTYNYFGEGFFHETVIFIGIVPLLLALLAMCSFLKNRTIKFFTILSVISAFLTIKSPFTLWFYKLPLPLVTTFLPSRIFYITSFAMAVLSGLGADVYFSQYNPKTKKRLLKICVAVLCISLIPISYIVGSKLQIKPLISFSAILVSTKKVNFLSQTNTIIMLKNTVLPIFFITGTGVIILLNLNKKITAFILIALTAMGQFYFLNKYAVLGYRQFLYPNHFILDFLSSKEKDDHSRFLVFGKPIVGNVAVDKHIYTPEGLDAVSPYRYAQLIQSAKNGGKLVKDVPRIEATLSELSHPESLLENKERLKLMNLLGVKYLFYYLEKPVKEKDLPYIFPSSQFKTLWQKDNWYAYENIGALPRAFLVSELVYQENPQSILDEIYKSSFDPVKKIIIEGASIDFIKTDPSTNNLNNAEITEYLPEHVTVKTKSEGNRFLFLSDNYSNGWQATLDSQPTKIYRADYAFRAVFVPSGEHTIVFNYYPKSFQYGLIITMTTVLGIFLISGAFIYFRKRKNF